MTKREAKIIGSELWGLLKMMWQVKLLGLMTVCLATAAVGGIAGLPRPIGLGLLLLGWVAFMCFAILALYGLDKEDKR